jgi:hypothetical protein
MFQNKKSLWQFKILCWIFGDAPLYTQAGAVHLQPLPDSFSPFCFASPRAVLVRAILFDNWVGHDANTNAPGQHRPPHRKQITWISTALVCVCYIIKGGRPRRKKINL